ncbi:histidine kinase [Sediminibacterium sp.]|uniref:sensor histidine kinase n=1 Tax=Sediminibacterium sp. TaxID=1917865 RepID=UPI002725458E|nr:histidine kinase [Sediminibacterium sp.]MDO9000436.1 histidine kinase [Bacteroidota bacterium]MDP3146996.1 histidine kinase [Bacteroidota bacterium]MDP3567467.1 histidine kinase [Sediminibacterium sp.]
MIKLKIIFVFVFAFFISKSQQPSFFTLGGDELEGTKIYCFHQSKDKILYIASDQGLIVYNGYTFESVKLENALSNGIFDLTEDYSGNIFFFNLSGQIFKYKDGACNLYYTIPDSLMQSDFDIEIDNLNRLIISSKKIIVVELNKKPFVFKNKFVNQMGDVHFLIKEKDSSISIFGIPNYLAVKLKNNRFKYQKFIFDGVDTLAGVSGLIFNHKLYLYLTKTKELYSQSQGKLHKVIDAKELVKNNSYARYYTSSDVLWLVKNSKGLFQFDKQLKIKNNSNLIFENTFISTVYEDRESNILLGTFGKGILVIPNQNAFNISLPAQTNAITITNAEEFGFFYGTEGGVIYNQSTNGDLSVFRNSGRNGVEFLKYLGNDKLLYNDGNSKLVDLKNKTEKILELGSIKDVFILNDSICYIASNYNGYILNSKRSSIQTIPQLEFRLYCIAYNKNNAVLYAGTSRGLAFIINNERIKYFKYKNQNVIAQNIILKDNLAYVATANSGVFIFKGDSLINHWEINRPFSDITSSKIKSYKNNFYITSKEGLNVFDRSGKQIQLINKSSGLSSNTIIDFEIINDTIWLINNRTVQQLTFSKLDLSPELPVLTIDKVVVNDSTLADTIYDFNYKQKKFSFHLKAISLKHQNEIVYQYQLIGAESFWRESNYLDHIIDYKSLAPGDYTFKTRLKFRNKFSPTLAYSFVIHKPFWQSFWFIIVVFILVLGVISLLFIAWLKRQREEDRKRNELNSSKLTAIQSQMNPHFIFNALNSIQDLVLKKDVEQSYDYITKFANLIRSTLSNSDKEFIDFENEVKLINLYLSIEKMRFKTDLETYVNINDVEGILVPPMLIQPFIENAFVHGLLHRKGSKKISITFTLDSELKCVIEDNGIGREKAKEIKARQKRSHESFSSEAIKNRFEILKHSFGGNLNYYYDDLKENGLVVGTRVTINLPFKRRF